MSEPWKIYKYRNVAGSIAFRWSATLAGERVRKNFKRMVEADLCKERLLSQSVRDTQEKRMRPPPLTDNLLKEPLDARPTAGSPTPPPMRG